MSNYDYLSKIYAFADENGYKVKNLNAGERRNQRGRYAYVSLAFVIPRDEEVPTDELNEKLEKDNEV